MSYYNNYQLESSSYPNFTPNPEQYYSQNFDPYYYQNFASSAPAFQSCDQPKTYDLFLHTDVTSAKYKTDDDLLIEDWLQNIGKFSVKQRPMKKKPPKCSFQIHVAKKSLHDCLQVLDKMQHMQTHLQLHAATMSLEEWNDCTEKITDLKNSFSKQILPFKDAQMLDHLRTAVERRRRKRSGHEQKRRARHEAAKRLHEDMKKEHDRIDQWLEHGKEQAERAKMEESMRKDADVVLSEVTKKKVEARKLTNVISSLIKLRSVREHAATQQGNRTLSEDRNAFSKVTEQLLKIWDDAQRVYAKEEQGLRLMLEQNAAVDNKVAEAAKERKTAQEWESILFGPKAEPTPAYNGLMCAEKDMDTFIAIRKSWDTFLMNADDVGGSRMPLGWILPITPADRWTQYLY